MNRLIIIGNGFDLAHGLETSFKDFILTYLADSYNGFIDKRFYEDVLISIKPNSSIYFPNFSKVNKDEVLDRIKDLNSYDTFNFKYKSAFLEKVISRIELISWVDLELEFFDSLIENRSNNVKWKGSIKQINNDLDFIKDKLIEYLQKICAGKKIHPSFDLAQCFTSYIKANEVRTIKLEKSILPENLYFLNFNYTDTLSTYLNPIKIPHEENYIHGDLNREFANPIFGFGDELDKIYLEFEDQKNNDLFKHIKSFQYLLSTNYFNLIRFIESDDFQVHIYGHSCGLSDRTMLNQIFEHENCKSIKIYYHKIDEDKNDFVIKTYDIARHFKDKVLFRKKLVPFPLSEPMPQPQKCAVQ